MVLLKHVETVFFAHILMTCWLRFFNFAPEFVLAFIFVAPPRIFDDWLVLNQSSIGYVAESPRHQWEKWLATLP